MSTNEMMLTFFAGLCGVVLFSMLIYGFLKWRQEKLKCDLQQKLLERFASPKELEEFLVSESGKGFMKSLAIGTPPAPEADTRGKLAGAVQKGIVLAAMGVGAFIMSGVVSGRQATEAFTVFGIFFLALGVGFLLATAASYWLARRG